MNQPTSKPSAALFIDASNFYHSLKEQNDMPFDYTNLINELNKQFDLKTINFYDAIKDRTKDPLGYAGQQRFHSRLSKAIPNIHIRTRPLRYVLTISEEKAAETAKELGLPPALNDKLYLFLKKLGTIKLSREKGLDVLIVTDMLNVHKENKHERLILLSGDSDYVPAVEFMIQEGARVVNLHMWSGSSKELREACSSHILINIDVDGQVKLSNYS